MEHFRKYQLLILFLSLINFKAIAQGPVRTLNYFLDEAVNRSPLIKDLANQQQTSKIDSMRLRAGYKPQVTASADGMYAPVIHGYGYDEVITNGQALDALINVNYNLVNKNNIKNQLQGIRLQSDSLKIASRLSILDLQRTIAEQYLTALGSQQQATFLKTVSDLLQREETILKKLTQANVYKQVDYLTFLVTFKQQQLDEKQAELQLRTDYLTLNYLTGIADTTVQQLEDPGLQSTLVTTDNQIFNRKLSLDSAQIANQKAAVYFLYQPKIGVYANSGYNSSLAFQPYRNLGASAGFTITVPIYDGHQKKMIYNKLAIEQQTNIAYKEFFVSQHTQQINLLKRQINDHNALYQKIKEQIKFTKSLLDVDSRLLQTGDIRVADFILAINNYLTAQNLLKQTNIDRLKLINQLNYWNR
jgi:outer membrane protein TolC